MRGCDEVLKRLADLAQRNPAEIPPPDRAHLAGCPACGRALAAARLARGLLAAAAEVPEAPAGFAERVVAALPVGPARRHAGPDVGRDLWRWSWGLVPLFAAATAALLLVFRGSILPVSEGLIPREGLSAGERLVLEARPSNPDLVLAAVMEGGGG